jgi:hypothetical protein
MKIEGYDLTADIDFAENGRSSLMNHRVVIADQWPPLKWTVFAPDRYVNLVSFS